MPSFDIAGRRSYQGDVLSLPLPYVSCLLSRSRMCWGRHCRGHPVHVSQVGGCPHMCPWVGPHALSFGRQLWSLPSRVEYLSPQGVLLPLVYGTTASPLWLELRGHSAWQATPSWTVYQLACHRLLPWLRVTFAMVPDAAWLGPEALEYRSCHWPGGSAGSPQCVRPMGCWFFPVPRPPYVCAVSWDAWLLFTGVPARFVVLHLRCPRPLGSCSPVCSLGVLCCVCGVLGQMAPVHRCASWVCCVACAVSRATGLLFTGAPARCVALRARCPGSLGSCSPVCPLGVFFCLCGVLGHLVPVHRCARAVCCVLSVVSWATWLLYTGVPAWCVVLRVWRPGPLGPRSPVCPPGVLCCVCSVPGHLAPVHRCARLVCCFACAVSRASWLLFIGVAGRGVSSLLLPSVHARVLCPGPRGARSPVCALCAVCVCHWWLCPSSSPPHLRFSFDGKKKKKKRKEKQWRAYTAGTGTGSWCGGAIVFCPLACVVSAVAAVAPQGCGSRVLMTTGMGQGCFR